MGNCKFLDVTSKPYLSSPHISSPHYVCGFASLQLFWNIINSFNLSKPWFPHMQAEDVEPDDSQGSIHICHLSGLMEE